MRSPTVSNCEFIGANIDGTAHQFKKDTASDRSLILIAGSRSSSNRKHDIARLDQAANYYTRIFDIPQDRIVTAVGPSSGSLS